MIGHSTTPGGILDKAIDAEEAEHKDFLRLDHVEGYHELSTKTRLYFSTITSMWDADFYVKVDDDIHLNLGTYVCLLNLIKCISDNFFLRVLLTLFRALKALVKKKVFIV